jgi:hypothetical protein
MPDIKVCKGCDLEKPMSEFPPRKNGRNGINSRCRECLNAQKRATKDYGKKQNPDYARNYSLKKTYGITQQDYLNMLVEQNHKCKICGKDELQTKYNKLVVDHNHATGEVRALLCTQCNIALGMAQESIDILLSMISYLGEYHS